MDIDPDPPIRTLRQELLKTLRQAAFDTYVNLPGIEPDARRDAEGILFADTIVAAITPEVFCDAYHGAVRGARRLLGGGAR